MWYFQGLPELALFVLTALFSGVVLVMVHRFFGPPTAPTKRDTQATDSNSINQIAFLFDGPNLLDATPAAHNMIEAIPNPSPGLTEIAAFLEQRFPGLQKRLAVTSPTTQKLIATNPPGSVARLDRSGESLRLSIQNSKASSISMDPMAMAAMREELAALRHIGESAPQLIWKLGSSNNVVWANAAYLSLVDQVQKPAPGLITDWPPLRLFSDLQIDSG